MANSILATFSGPLPLPELLAASEVATRLGVSVRTVGRLTSSGELPTPVRIGNCTRWSCSEITAWIQGLPKV